jgi:hypothetical protein
MRKLLLFFALTCCILSPGLSSAQSFTIKGQVIDTLNDNKLPYASITLIRAKDSVLETFTRTRDDGSFTLKTPDTGKFILMITFPGFADYLDEVSTGKKEVIDLGPLPLVTKAHLLSEFVLKQQISAIKIKGDTTEYMADSFKVRENATVEELLRKLPGIQVNKEGEVIAHGEKVEKILVDGEEFFTDDPAVVTKSLQSKAVEKVQVFDKKSEQAEFTGIDDGVREKTINLQLKDNMKKGYFGKITAGGGTDGFFENQGMVNAFKGKRKISAFGIMANTGKIGLGWEDADKFGGSSGNVTEFTDDGSMISYYSSDDDDGMSWGGNYHGQGLPTAWTAGVHYSNKWKQDAHHFSTNYRFARQNIETQANTVTELNIDSATKLYTLENKNVFNTGDRQRIDALYEWKVDTNSTVKLTANAGYTQTRTSSAYETRTLDNNEQLANNNTRNITNEGTGRTANASLNWKKKFSKKGRTLSLSMDESFKENEGNGYYNSITNFYALTDPSQLDSVINIRQLKDNHTKNLQLNGKLSYTEPLSKVMFAEVNYAATLNNSYASKLSYEKEPGDTDYDSLNTAFSSIYDFNVFTNTGGANLRFVFKKLNFSFGGSMSNTRFSQEDNLSDSFNLSYTRSYTNFFSRASLSYKLKAQRSIYLSYNGSTRQPTIDQIQPLRQNTDPLNISEGNPELKQEFSHNINVRYNDYKVLTGTYAYLSGGVNFTDDDISRTETISPGGGRRYKYVNVDGNYNGWFYGGYGWNIKKIDLRVTLRGNANFGQVNSIINGQQNRSNNNSYSLGLDVNYDKEKKFNIWYSPSVTYNNNTSTVNTTATNYWSYENQLSGNVQLPWKFEIGTEIEWFIRQKVAGFDRNNDVFKWNAYVSKKFLKGDELELRASVFDILNQNQGFSRYGYGNTITEQNYNTIRRYGMLTLIWNFTKTAAGMPEASGSDIIIAE